ncbi:MAG: hypothetical protein LLF94_07600 [Chlamydiales bacterium]|nr:hypothetical protein [Chlamydiales bacterium]
METNQKVVAGAVIGGVLACVAVSLLCCNKKKRNTIVDTLEEYGDKVKSMMNNVSATDMIDTVQEHIADFPSLDNKDFVKGVVVGTTIAGLVGTGASMFLNGKSCQSSSWCGYAKNILDAVNTVKKSNATQDAMHLLNTGIKFWNQIKK